MNTDFRTNRDVKAVNSTEEKFRKRSVLAAIVVATFFLTAVSTTSAGSHPGSLFSRGLGGKSHGHDEEGSKSKSGGDDAVLFSRGLGSKSHGHDDEEGSKSKSGADDVIVVTRNLELVSEE